ncbi:MAG: molybdenum cofactor biosynthesis protein MoaE [Parvularculaceae bacterium]|nr:molybdenum cofactor biosynthesis protein MoaE [Parvularculaceae bacterium]
MTSVLAFLSNTPFDPETELARFRRRFDSAGGIVAFTGQVRADAGAATRLFLDHYPGFTERHIESICRDAASRFNLDGVLVVHRVGEMGPAEPIVLAAAAASHRRQAFEAVDFLMDYVKSEAPIWKREFDGVHWRWIEPTARDREEKARWSVGAPCRA